MTTPILENPHQKTLDLLETGTVEWCHGALFLFPDDDDFEPGEDDDFPFEENAPPPMEYCAVGRYGRALFPDIVGADGSLNSEESMIMSRIEQIWGIHTVEEIATIMVQRFWRVYFHDEERGLYKLQHAIRQPEAHAHLAALIVNINDSAGFSAEAMKEALREAAASYEART